MKKHAHGWIGWLGIAAVVAAWDVTALRQGLESMSSAYARCPKWVAWPATGYVVLHLLGRWPQRLDPFERVGALLTPR